MFIYYSTIFYRCPGSSVVERLSRKTFKKSFIKNKRENKRSWVRFPPGAILAASSFPKCPKRSAPNI